MLNFRYAAPLFVDISERIVRYGAKAGEQNNLHKQVSIGNIIFIYSLV